MTTFPKREIINPLKAGRSRQHGLHPLVNLVWRNLIVNPKSLFKFQIYINIITEVIMAEFYKIIMHNSQNSLEFMAAGYAVKRKLRQFLIR